MLEARHRPPGIEEARRWRGPVLVGLAVAALVIVLVLVIAGGLDNDIPPHRHHGGRAHHGHHQPSGAPSGPLTLRLETLDGVQVCLVSSGRPVIDAQALAPGSKAGPFDGRRFRLDLDSPGGGRLRLKIDGKGRRIRAHHRASYTISSRGVAHTTYKGPRCP